ncbi:hypothetical protein [Proteiniborus sp.]|uniref:hypothetical protein n=1 Tax=Proteiniborus sp. TaxID=2079015 RepID=UPI0033334F99
MDKNGNKQGVKREDTNMDAVLSLDQYKINSSTKTSKKEKKCDISKFFNDNIDDIIELELNTSGLDEFLDKFSKKE